MQPPESDYELIAASATDQICGPTGHVGDVLTRLIIVPETTGAGTVAIQDGDGTAINVFIAGTLSDLHTIVIEIGARCVNATTPGWSVTTGANVHVLAVGRFT